MKKIFSKLFLAGDWKTCLTTKGGLKPIFTEKKFWYADPFLFEHNGIRYIFVEAFDTKKELGKLGYLSSLDEYSTLNLIINEKCHYSFPNVFKIQDSVYMIPESSEKQGVFLYKFKGFPNEMVCETKLLDGEYVDTALIKICGNTGFFLTYSTSKRELYSFSLDFKTKGVIFNFVAKDDNKQLRPAGNAFIENGELLMPFQNCKNKYGESIIFRKVSVDDKIVLGEVVRELSAKDVKISAKVKRIHTYNVLKDNIVIDYMEEKFSLIKPFKMLKRILRRKKNKRAILNGKEQ